MIKNQIWLPVAIVIGLLVGVSMAYVYKYATHTSTLPSVELTSNTEQKADTQQKEAIAYVTSAVGNNTKISGNISSKVASGDILYTNDILKTDTTGTLELVYADSSIIRIAGSTIYELRDKDTGKLESGSLWARIIRPITDAKFFTLESSDLSAWVRGTAVSMSTSGSGSEVIVVDSSLEKDAVDIRATTASGIIQTSLNPEESLSTFKLGGGKKTKVNMQRLLADPRVVRNIKNDILYLVNLKKSWTPSNSPLKFLPIDIATSEKIEKEIIVSLPKATELQGFFESKAIELEYSQVGVDTKTGTGVKILTPSDENRIRILFSDEISLIQMKSELQTLRTQNIMSNDEEKKDEFQKSVNSLQEKIQGFDQSFTRSYLERLNDAEKSVIMQWVGVESSGSITSTGVVVPSPNPSTENSSTGSVTPKIVTPSGDTSPPKKSQWITKPTIPKPIVSSTARIITPPRITSSSAIPRSLLE